MKTFTIQLVNRTQCWIDGANVKEIFQIIDGLRLVGKRWLEAYVFGDEIGEVVPIYVNIDHIVSIQ